MFLRCVPASRGQWCSTANLANGCCTLSNAIGPRARHSDQQPVDGASELLSISFSSLATQYFFSQRCSSLFTRPFSTFKSTFVCIFASSLIKALTIPEETYYAAILYECSVCKVAFLGRSLIFSPLTSVNETCQSRGHPAARGQCIASERRGGEAITDQPGWNSGMPPPHTKPTRSPPIFAKNPAPPACGNSITSASIQTYLTELKPGFLSLSLS